MANEFKVKNGLILASGALITSGSAGTSGYILTSNGSGSSPSWQANAGGGGGGSSSLVDISQTGITTSTTIYSASSTTYRGAEYTFQITNSTAYAMYKFFVMHDGTSVFFPYNSNGYVGDSSGLYNNYMSGDYLATLASQVIQVGATYHALSWAVTGGNLVFSASCSSGTIDVKGSVLLIKA